VVLVKLDTLGLKCPQPVLKIAAASADIKEGNTLEVLADCPTFEKDVRLWCERVKKTLLWIKDEGNNKKRCHIQF
jgi:tRNA 2-thiouridine synthesizing protein A